MNEISFNSTFWLELTAIAAILSLLDEGLIDSARFPRVNFHGIEGGHLLGKLGASSKMNNTPAFIDYLFRTGYEIADAWVAENRDAIGQRSTIDLKQLLPMTFSWSHRNSNAVAA